MFGMLTSIAKAASAVVDIPVSIVADVVTFGGSINGKSETYTGKAVEKFVENVSDITDPDKF
jgi:hypothetical protein